MARVSAQVSTALADPARLAALQAADLLDTPAEKTFDGLAQLAARTLSTPIALVSLIDDERQFFKAQVGLPEPWRLQREIPLSESVCKHALASREPLNIPDVRCDARVRDSAAARELRAVAYLGIALITSDGHALGVFCVVDTVPRAWTDEDIATMQVLADAALSEIELRLRQHRLRDAAAQRMTELARVNEALHAETVKGNRVKATLREHEAQLTRIIETMAEGLVLIDREGRYTITNAAMERILGVPRRQIIGCRYDQVPWKRAMVNGSAFTLDKHPFVLLKQGLNRLQGYEFGIEAPDGQVRIISLNAEPLHDRTGEFDGIVATYVDVTEGKRAEGGLRASEERFRLLVESIKDYAIFMVDRDGRVASWNAGAERIKGYQAEEIIGQHFSCFYPPEAIAGGQPNEELTISARAGRFEEEGWRVRKDGSKFWANVIITALYDADGNLGGYSTVTRDITQRRFAENALKESEARFRAIFESAGVGFAQIASNGRFLAVNPAFCRLLDYTREHLLQKTFLEVTHPDDLPGELEKVGALLAGDIESYELDKRYVRADGTLVWVRLTSSVVRDPTGAALYRFSVTEDITERRRAREALQQLNRELEARVRDRTAQLEAANRELEAFSYSVSHDLRAPLRAIDGFSQAVLEEYGDKLEEPGRRYLERVRAASQRMGALIEDLLGLARVTRSDLNRENASLGALASSIVGELERADPARAVQFAITDDLPVSADPRLLRILLENLLGNAWKFSRRTPNARIELGVTEQDGNQVYFVRDNGAGFDMAYADKLFGAFQRLHPASEYEGTGIGLATVERIVQRHGGRCWAEGDVGRGATFYFTLNGPRASLCIPAFAN